MVRAMFAISPWSCLGSPARRTALLLQDDVARVPETHHVLPRHLLRLRRLEDAKTAQGVFAIVRCSRMQKSPSGWTKVFVIFGTARFFDCS